MRSKTRHESDRSLMKRLPGLAIAAGVALAFSLNVQAQDLCTTANWSDGQGVSGVVFVGTQGSENRRYAGPCGARMVGDGNNFLVDDSPSAESTYIARFYAFLDDLSGEVAIFDALNSAGDPEIQVWFDSGLNRLTLRIYDANDQALDLHATAIGSGWHSVELVWEASESAEIRFAVNSSDTNDDVVISADTSGLEIHAARLGLINGADSSVAGHADFDDFDSRRNTRPGRLLRGDATNSGSVTLSDLFAVNTERTGGAFAAGQPDCTESGSITLSDLFCVNAIRTGQ